MYLSVTPCPNCSGGPWEVTTEETSSSNGDESDLPVRTLRARCLHCGNKKEFVFESAESSEDVEAEQYETLEGASVDLVNPTPSPSEIIDLGQWLSLFYLLVEQAAAAKGAESRRLGFQAAQCIEEALKFYTEDDELPPKSAFFVEASRRTFAEHPEKFARQRLRDLRSKLPDLRIMARKISHDTGEKQKKPWWRFWKS